MTFTSEEPAEIFKPDTMGRARRRDEKRYWMNTNAAGSAGTVRELHRNQIFNAGELDSETAAARAI